MAIISYMTVEEADDYLIQLFGEIYDDWPLANDQTKAQALNSATRMIDRLPMSGVAASPTAEQFFPRVGEDEVPTPIKEACAEIAAALVHGRDPQLDYEEMAIIGHRIGKVGTNRDSDKQLPHIVAGIPSLAAWKLLQPYMVDAFNIKLTRA